MRKARYQQNQIVKLLGCSGGTISREVRRNIGARDYCHKKADEPVN
jgi:IS30 family transposase